MHFKVVVMKGRRLGLKPRQSPSRSSSNACSPQPAVSSEASPPLLISDMFIHRKRIHIHKHRQCQFGAERGARIRQEGGAGVAPSSRIRVQNGTPITPWPRVRESVTRCGRSHGDHPLTAFALCKTQSARMRIKTAFLRAPTMERLAL